MNLDPPYSWFGRAERKQRRTKKKNPKFEQILKKQAKEKVN